VSELTGLGPQIVENHFKIFLHEHPTLIARQVQFMNLLKTHISQHGSFETSNMRKFYQAYPKQDAVRPELSLIH